MSQVITPEKVAAANSAALESLSAVSSLGLSSVERLAALNLNTARAGLSDAAANIEALSAIKDPQALVSFVQGLAEPTLASALAYVRSVYGIATDCSEELSKVIDAQLAEMNKAVAVALDEVSKSAPAGSDVAVAAVRSAIAAANETYDTVAKATKQVVALAEANVPAGTAVKPARKAAKKAA
ncbi:MAG: phasin family protein [Rhodocyclaceae bacterium]|nr:phasin family protein [Rhodocyclaceae bacterium]